MARVTKTLLIRPVILSGGVGTRLWPMSRALNPKQLLPLAAASTMIQETVRRVERMRPLLEAGGQSMARGAVRFCLSHPAVSTVIAGSTHAGHIADVSSASDAGPLDASVRLKLKSHAWPRNFYP